MIDRPALAEGEAARFEKESVGLAWFRSGLNARAIPSIPVLQGIGVYVTDRRVILRGEILLALYDRDISFWFPDAAPEPSAEVITRAETGEVAVLGRYLRLDTYADKKHRFRAKEASWHVFLAEAEELLALIPGTSPRP